jgi:hypothetical protein
VRVLSGLHPIEQKCMELLNAYALNSYVSIK